MERVIATAVALAVTLTACGTSEPEVDEARAEQTFNDYFNALGQGDWARACEQLATPDGKRAILSTGAPPETQERVEFTPDLELDRLCQELMEASFRELDVPIDPDRPDTDFLQGVEARKQGDEILMTAVENGGEAPVRLTSDYKILELPTQEDLRP